MNRKQIRALYVVLLSQLTKRQRERATFARLGMAGAFERANNRVQEIRGYVREVRARFPELRGRDLEQFPTPMPVEQRYTCYLGTFEGQPAFITSLLRTW